MTLAIAILMKDPADAKTRLSGALAFDARERLALALFENTLAFFRKTFPNELLGVVTPSPRIAALATAQQAEAVAQGKPGINSAAASAAAWAQQNGAGRLLVVHADIPTLVATEISALLSAGEDHAVVIGESVDGGSNALLVSPPDVIPFCFGPQSATAHEAAARALKQTATRLRLPYLSKDLDTPADLDAHPELIALSKTAPAREIGAFAVAGIPEVADGDDLAALITSALTSSERTLLPGDIVVIAQKIVSKSESRMRRLADYVPSPEAETIAADIGKDPRKVEAILRESSHVLRAKRMGPDGLLITRHRHGWICANAAIDESNLGDDKAGMLLLLPDDPDASARRIRMGLEEKFGGPIGVVVTDTFGRPWRNGLVNIAIGTAGVAAIDDWTDRTDAYGRGLKATLPALADEIAAAAGLLMQKDAGIPVVVLRGLTWNDTPQASAQDVLRPMEQELFL
ncbi:coenzyme F420-0:L-glutamate ligase [Corticibacterium sp. UT-5YL-CI-8]|nr:coenzyme F420-0:L-glutamate ligase [Tianweitania sp. UT-5YL-CI-8]